MGNFLKRVFPFFIEFSSQFIIDNFFRVHLLIRSRLIVVATTTNLVVINFNSRRFRLSSNDVDAGVVVVVIVVGVLTESPTHLN